MTTNKTMTREQWNSLRYPVSLHQMPEDEGGYWVASIPTLGEGLFVADGDTPQEAIDSLEERRQRFYDKIVAAGKPITLPPHLIEKSDVPSGRWLQRTSPSFHAELKQAARKSNLSLNEYCNQCLQRGHAISCMDVAVKQTVALVHTSVQKSIDDMSATVHFHSDGLAGKNTIRFAEDEHSFDELMLVA